MSLWHCLDCGALTGGSVGAPRCASCGSASVRWVDFKPMGQITATGASWGAAGLAENAATNTMPAQTCETCRHQVSIGAGYCNNAKVFTAPDGWIRISCEAMGNFCGAWAAKDQPPREG
jgi:hypothetical protein